MKSVKIGAVTYRSQQDAIKNLLKNSKKSVSEIAKLCGALPSAVSICNNKYNIRQQRKYTHKSTPTVAIQSENQSQPTIASTPEDAPHSIAA